MVFSSNLFFLFEFLGKINLKTEKYDKNHMFNHSFDHLLQLYGTSKKSKCAGNKEKKEVVLLILKSLSPLSYVF